MEIASLILSTLSSIGLIIVTIYIFRYQNRKSNINTTTEVFLSLLNLRLNYYEDFVKVFLTYDCESIYNFINIERKKDKQEIAIIFDKRLMILRNLEKAKMLFQDNMYNKIFEIIKQMVEIDKHLKVMLSKKEISSIDESELKGMKELQNVESECDKLFTLIYNKEYRNLLLSQLYCGDIGRRESFIPIYDKYIEKLATKNYDINNQHIYTKK